MDKANVLNAVSGLASKVPQDADTHMGDDGLLYCNACNTPRQARINLCGELFTVPCICKCMSERYEAEQERQRQQDREMKIERYRQNCFAEPWMLNARFGTADESKQIGAAKRYVDNFAMFRRDGKGLYFHGDCGTGKTYAAACIINAVLDSGKPCLMTSIPRLVERLNNYEDPMNFASLSKYALVALDDFGVERTTDFMVEQINTIIDTLYEANIPMIVTSNIAPKQLRDEKRMARACDRILGRCHPIMFDGESKRKEAGRHGYKAMQELLGL